jgi:hypothetical protein
MWVSYESLGDCVGDQASVCVCVYIYIYISLYISSCACGRRAEGTISLRGRREQGREKSRNTKHRLQKRGN